MSTPSLAVKKSRPSAGVGLVAAWLAPIPIVVATMNSRSASPWAPEVQQMIAASAFPLLALGGSVLWLRARDAGIKTRALLWLSSCLMPMSWFVLSVVIGGGPSDHLPTAVAWWAYGFFSVGIMAALAIGGLFGRGPE